MNDEKRQVDEAIQELEAAGITPEDIEQQKSGVGDIIANIFAKFGITNETVERWVGVDDCGCDKRKQFLNKILPLNKRE